MPLRGPWSRPEDRRRPAGREMSPAEDREEQGEAEIDGDLPIDGPWNRPPENRQPRAEAGEQLQAEEPGRQCESQGDGLRAAAAEAPETSGDTPCDCPGSDGYEKHCPGNARRRAANSLFTARGIYNGFIMAEILGRRGGRSRRGPF